MAIASLALRDLLVCLIVIPAGMDWVAAGMLSWPGGETWCKTAMFFDYYLTTLHPLLVLCLCVILYTRKLPPKEPAPLPPPSQHHMNSRMSHRSGYTHQTHHNTHMSPSVRGGSVRPPSVAGSVQSASRHDGTFRKGFAKKEGSLNGSWITLCLHLILDS